MPATTFHYQQPTAVRCGASLHRGRAGLSAPAAAQLCPHLPPLPAHQTRSEHSHTLCPAQHSVHLYCNTYTAAGTSGWRWASAGSRTASESAGAGGSRQVSSLSGSCEAGPASKLDGAADSVHSGGLRRLWGNSPAWDTGRRVPHR